MTTCCSVLKYNLASYSHTNFYRKEYFGTKILACVCLGICQIHQNSLLLLKFYMIWYIIVCTSMCAFFLQKCGYLPSATYSHILKLFNCILKYEGSCFVANRYSCKFNNGTKYVPCICASVWYYSITFLCTDTIILASYMVTLSDLHDNVTIYCVYNLTIHLTK